SRSDGGDQARADRSTEQGRHDDDDVRNVRGPPGGPAGGPPLPEPRGDRGDRGRRGPEPGVLLEDLVAKLSVKLLEKHPYASDGLIGIVESSMTAPTFDVLKRPDEGRLVEMAHARPRFVEDVVREVLARVLQKYKDLPDDVLVKVKSDSEESIHKHDAVAERVATLGELRAP